MPTKPRAAASKRDLGDKYLTRADYRGSRGYWARVCGQGGYLEPRWFSVAAHGTWAAAKRAAKAHVQAVVTRHRLKPRPCGDRSPRPYTRCKRTPDGYSIGVNLSLTFKPDGLYYPAWEARWRTRNAAGEPVQHSRSFSVLRYGYREAFQRALRARRQGLGQRGPLPASPALAQIAAQLRKRLGPHWKSQVAVGWGAPEWRS